MYTKVTAHPLLIILFFCFLVIPITACAESTLKIEDNVDLVITIDNQNNVKTYDRFGNEAKKCEICSPRLEEFFGPNCINATKPEYIKKYKETGNTPICYGLFGGTTKGLTQIFSSQNKVNPYCRTTSEGGVEKQVCYCAPGERDPRCVN